MDVLLKFKCQTTSIAIVEAHIFPMLNENTPSSVFTSHEVQFLGV